MKLNWKKDEVTGNLIANFTGKLVSVAENAIENVNGTQYRPCTVTINDAGQKTNITGIMYEKNYEHGVDIGDNLLCRASYDPEQEGEDIFVNVSHLKAAERATLSTFGLDKAPSVKEEVEEEEDAGSYEG
jgi:hypothetical protein